MPLPPSTVEDAYRHYFPIIREKCRRMLLDAHEAEDAAQETFIRFWKERIHERGELDGVRWIYRVATHASVDRLRRRRVRESYAANNASHAAQEPSVGADLRQIVERLSARLPQRTLEVGLLSRCDRLTQKEISEVAGISERHVRRLLEQFEVTVTALFREVHDV